MKNFGLAPVQRTSNTADSACPCKNARNLRISRREWYEQIDYITFRLLKVIEGAHG